MAQGQAGYVQSTITITTGGAYTGDGINGWVGGTAYSFRVAERNFKVERPRQTTTDGPYDEGVGGPIKASVRIKGYFKGDIPNSTFQNEFIKIVANTVFDFAGVILVESFDCVGVIDQAVTYEITGTTDGTFTNA